MSVPHRTPTIPPDDAPPVVESTSRLRLVAAPTLADSWQESVVASSPHMLELMAQIRRYADAPASVLLSGESGTGKDVFARLIHRWSRRADQPMINVNCAALPAALAESELFGHTEGAFTGAERRRAGKFEAAHRGTLFLDEISEMPLRSQAKLLRVLEGGEVQRIGSDTAQTVDVRVVAATNRDLPREIRKGRFRADLYYRLNVLQLHLPSLRERRAEIPELVRCFVQQYRRTDPAASVLGIDDAALQCLLDYHWPGNIRELRNVIQRACVLCDGPSIRLAHLPLPWTPSRADDRHDYRDLTLKEMEHRAIVYALRKYQGNRTAAARHLGVTVRTLQNRLRADPELRKVR